MLLERQKNKHDAKCRLLCFAYAGGNGNIFNPWVKGISKEIEIITINYPGRGRDINKPVIDNCIAMAKAIASELNQLDDLPTVFFGYSMGGAIAYETARHVTCRVDHLLLCASRPPNTGGIQKGSNQRYLESDAALEQDIKNLGGIDERLFLDTEMRAIILKIMRADFKLLDTYHPETFDLKAKIHVIYGTQDVHVTLSKASLWSNFTHRPIAYLAIEGGHFLIKNNSLTLLEYAQKRCLEAIKATNTVELTA